VIPSESAGGYALLALRHDGRPGRAGDGGHCTGRERVGHHTYLWRPQRLARSLVHPHLTERGKNRMPPFDRFDQGRTDPRGCRELQQRRSARGVRAGIIGSVPTHPSTRTYLCQSHGPSVRSFEFVTREALCNCHSSPLLPQAALFRCTEQWRLPSTHDLSIKTRPSLLSRGSAATYLRFACVRTDDYFVSVHVTLSFEEDATIRSVAFVHRSRVC
jgi:hypothetical protein